MKKLKLVYCPNQDCLYNTTGWAPRVPKPKRCPICLTWLWSKGKNKALKEPGTPLETGSTSLPEPEMEPKP